MTFGRLRADFQRDLTSLVQPTSCLSPHRRRQFAIDVDSILASFWKPGCSDKRPSVHGKLGVTGKTDLTSNSIANPNTGSTVIERKTKTVLLNLVGPLTDNHPVFGHACLSGSYPGCHSQALCLTLQEFEVRHFQITFAIQQNPAIRFFDNALYAEVGEGGLLFKSKLFESFGHCCLATSSHLHLRLVDHQGYLLEKHRLHCWSKPTRLGVGDKPPSLIPPLLHDRPGRQVSGNVVAVARNPKRFILQGLLQQRYVF